MPQNKPRTAPTRTSTPPLRVGAALLLEGGEIVTAANVENASYGLSAFAREQIPPSRRAIAQHGLKLRITAVAVTNLNHASSSPVRGACRQVLCGVYAVRNGARSFPLQHGTLQIHTLAELFPLGFDLHHAE